MGVIKSSVMCIAPSFRLSSSLRMARRLVLVMGLFAYWGCVLDFAGMQVSIEVPALPDFIADNMSSERVVLEYLGPDGRMREDEISILRRSCSLLVSKSRVVPILARIELTGLNTERLVCGAFILGDEAIPDVIRLQWSEGFLADFLLAYLDASGNDGWFNVRELQDRIVEATDGNPWNIDRYTLNSAFEFYLLSRSMLRRAGKYQVQLRLPRGRWFYADPLEADPVIVGDEIVTLSVCRGYHELFHSNGEGLVRLFVGKYSWTALITDINGDPTDVVSGNV